MTGAIPERDVACAVGESSAIAACSASPSQLDTHHRANWSGDLSRTGPVAFPIAPRDRSRLRYRRASSYESPVFVYLSQVTEQIRARIGFENEHVRCNFE